MRGQSVCLPTRDTPPHVVRMLTHSTAACNAAWLEELAEVMMVEYRMSSDTGKNNNTKRLEKRSHGSACCPDLYLL
jgi:hypothetical protein